MRVLHVQKARGIGGSERHLVDLLPRLSADGIDVRMCVLHAPGAERFTDELDDAGVSRVTVPAGWDVNPLLSWRLVREIRRFRADIVHTHLIHADLHGQAAARLAHRPGVASMHSVHRFFTREPSRSAERVALRSAATVIAISQHVADFLVRHRLVPAGRIRVVPYGVEVDRWSVSEAERADARARLAVGEDAFVVGMTSRLVPGKGHATAIEAARLAMASRPDLVLLIAGTGPQQDELARLIGADGSRIRLLGFLDDVRALLAACDAILVPTEPALGEGFGLGALEAMAAARPVIVTDVASLPEVVGDVGLVVPPGRPAELAEAIGSLARDPEAAGERGRAGRARAATRFGIDAMVAATEEVYREVLR